MRSFTCSLMFHQFLPDPADKKKLVRSIAFHKYYMCWNRVQMMYDMMKQFTLKPEYKNAYVHTFDYDSPNTRQYQKLIVDTINEITPCKFTKIKYKGTVYDCISMKVLDTYDKTLILLSFIRNLWYEPQQYNYKTGNHGMGAYESLDYTKPFFESLSQQTEGDAMERLCRANIAGCGGKVQAYLGHCNATSGTFVKTIKDLHKGDFKTTQEFFTKPSSKK